MTRDEWIDRVEKASGMSIEQFRALGVWPKEGFCRRLECLGWHFVNEDRDPAGDA